MLILPLLLLAGCPSTDTVDSTDVEDDAIWGDYDVDFDKENLEVSFYAQFRVGGSTGTTVRLSPPAEVSVDGTVMEEFDGDAAPINLSGTFYHLDADGEEPADTYTFTWTRDDGTTWNNVVTTAPSVSIAAPTEGAEHSISQDLTVTFAGEPLGSGDSLTCSLYAEAGSATREISSGESCIFPSSELAELAPGAATLQLMRHTSAEPQSGHSEAGGRLDSRYYSQEVAITLSK